MSGTASTKAQGAIFDCIVGLAPARLIDTRHTHQCADFWGANQKTFAHCESCPPHETTASFQLGPGRAPDLDRPDGLSRATAGPHAARTKRLIEEAKPTP